MQTEMTPMAAKEYLTFTLGSEHYAIDILAVKEIRGYDPPTKIAYAPPFLKGVINLRGEIVPIVDLRIKFALSEPTYTEFTIVIVLNVGGRMVGIVVDAVSDVVSIAQDQLRPPPDFGISFDSRYLVGLAPVAEHMVIVVAIEQLINSDELGLMDKTLAVDATLSD